MDNLIFGLSTTAVGMLVVFTGLIILIACISIMGALNKGAGKKKAAPKQEKAPMAAPAPVPPIQPEQAAAPVADDALIAVITAAIAAVWQGEQSGFVVRRVRRTDMASARARAAREEQIYSHF